MTRSDSHASSAVLGAIVITVSLAASETALACTCSDDWAPLFLDDGVARIDVLSAPECDETDCHQRVRVLEWCSGAPAGDVHVLTTRDETCGSLPLDLGEHIVAFGTLRSTPDPHVEMIMGGCRPQIDLQLWNEACRATRPHPPTNAGCASCRSTHPPDTGPIPWLVLLALTIAARIRAARRRPPR